MTFGPRQLNQLYMAYLEHSLRYYEMDDAVVVPDALFDAICKALLRHWGGFQHSLKHLTDVSALEAGSGYHLCGRPELDRVRSMMRFTGGRTLLEHFGEP